MSFNQRFRPMTIETVIGSLPVRTALTTLLDKEKLPQCIIFNGDNGIGKTSLAYATTHRLMCGCDKEISDCEVKRQLWGREDLSLSTNIYEIDLGKNRDDLFIDNVVDLFRIRGKKVIILDEIQNLSKINMTKFLKTMDNIDEETYLIICTTELHKLDTGIISRSEVFTLSPPSVIELATHLEMICRVTNNKFSREAIMLIAKSKYRVRDAIRSLETILDVYGEVTVEGVREYFGKMGVEEQLKYLKSCKNNSPYEMLFLLNEIQQTTGMYNFTEGFKEFMLNAVYIKNGIRPQQYLDEEVQEIYELLTDFNMEELSEILYRINRMPQKTNIDRQIGFVNLGLAISGGKLLNKLDLVESRKAEVKYFEPELDTSLKLGNEVQQNSFTLNSPATNPENIEESPTPKIDLFSDDDLEAIKEIFNQKGEVEDGEKEKEE